MQTVHAGPRLWQTPERSERIGSRLLPKPGSSCGLHAANCAQPCSARYAGVVCGGQAQPPRFAMHGSELDLKPEINLALNWLTPRGAAVKQWMEERASLKEERLLTFGTAAETASASTLADLLARCRASEELSDFAEAVLRLAVVEASRRKTEALGRLLALGLGDNETPEIDEAWLMLNAVADLEPPHLRVLRRLHDERTSHGVLDIELARMFPNGVPLMYPLLKTLERHGLAGPVPGGDAGAPYAAVEWAIWEFGTLVLERLFPEDGPSSS